MSVEISRIEPNVYEKIDKENWMLLPEFKPENITSYINIQDLVHYKNESSKHTDPVDVAKIFSSAL